MYCFVVEVPCPTSCSGTTTAAENLHRYDETEKPEAYHHLHPVQNALSRLCYVPPVPAFRTSKRWFPVWKSAAGRVSPLEKAMAVDKTSTAGEPKDFLRLLDAIQASPADSVLFFTPSFIQARRNRRGKEGFFLIALRSQWIWWAQASRGDGIWRSSADIYPGPRYNPRFTEWVSGDHLRALLVRLYPAWWCGTMLLSWRRQLAERQYTMTQWPQGEVEWSVEMFHAWLRDENQISCFEVLGSKA